jgi:CheY-like chemotaxis protein
MTMLVVASQRPRSSPPGQRRTSRPSTKASSPRAHPVPTRSLHRLDGLTIMVVEDHADSRELLRQVLEPLTTRVLLAENGYEALAILRTDPRPPDVILCDLLMPAMDGLNFARRLQQEPEWQSIPIVAVTALGQLADYIMTWTHGFQAHLTKPIEPALLVDVVRKLARTRSARPPTPTDEPQASG